MKKIQHYLLFILGILLITNCTSKELLLKEDYESSLYLHQSGKTAEVLKEFPKGEVGAFITTLEKTYLNLLQGNSDIKALAKQAIFIEKRFRFQASKELKSVFFAETAEGYYPSEHEIIWMHILLSWGYHLKGDNEKACVEARKTSHLLMAPWSHEGAFDDPFLRIINGAMWMNCGSWEDARVDFKRAFYLDNQLKWLLDLIQLNEPPKQLILILGGPGPEIIRANRIIHETENNVDLDLAFHLLGKKSKISIADKKGYKFYPKITPDARYWYARHFERNNSIHELIESSKYSAYQTAIIGRESLKVAGGVVVGTGVMTGSVVAGLAIMYVGLEVGSGEIFLLGPVVALGGIKKGLDIIDETYDTSKKEVQQKNNLSNYYRFSRFLPEYSWLTWSDLNYDFPLKISPGEHLIKDSKSRVIIQYLPDLKTPIEVPVNHKWLDWEATFIAAYDNGFNPDLLLLMGKAFEIKKIDAFNVDINPIKTTATIYKNKIVLEKSLGLFHSLEPIIILIKKDDIEFEIDKKGKIFLMQYTPEEILIYINSALKENIHNN
ncbi:MAG: hypothetical protein HOD92_09710 [Deltaproteobacteria bacterium]|jgi:hypothetical protein|nr:hypothetical protein [Deltaproteobacteria bacterium]